MLTGEPVVHLYVLAALPVTVFAERYRNLFPVNVLHVGAKPLGDLYFLIGATAVLALQHGVLPR